MKVGISGSEQMQLVHNCRVIKSKDARWLFLYKSSWPACYSCNISKRDGHTTGRKCYKLPQKLPSEHRGHKIMLRIKKTFIAMKGDKRHLQLTR